MQNIEIQINRFILHRASYKLSCENRIQNIKKKQHSDNNLVLSKLMRLRKIWNPLIRFLVIKHQVFSSMDIVGPLTRRKFWGYPVPYTNIRTGNI